MDTSGNVALAGVDASPTALTIFELADRHWDLCVLFLEKARRRLAARSRVERDVVLRHAAGREALLEARRDARRAKAPAAARPRAPRPSMSSTMKPVSPSLDAPPAPSRG